MDKAKLDSLRAKVLNLYGKYLQMEYDEIDDVSDNFKTPQMLNSIKEVAYSEWKQAEIEWQEGLKLYLFEQSRIKK